MPVAISPATTAFSFPSVSTMDPIKISYLTIDCQGSILEAGVGFMVGQPRPTPGCLVRGADGRFPMGSVVLACATGLIAAYVNARPGGKVSCDP